MVTAPLDCTVAQVVHAASLLEKAVHSAGAWTLAWGPHTIKAKRVLTDDGVIFSGEFPEVCYLERFEAPLALCLDGETVAVREMEWPGDRGFAVDWSIRGRLALASA